MALLSAYYTSSLNVAYSDLFTHFHTWLLSCLNLPAGSHGNAEIDHMTGESSWQPIGSVANTKSIPAIKLFTESDVGVATNQATPITTNHISSLEAYQETVIYALHLVYEVCVLSAVFPQNVHLDCNLV